MTYEEAISKAAKLLRLATSSNPHEAALAASRAQEIIDRFHLEPASLDLTGDTQAKPDEPIKDFGSDPLDGAHATWKWRFLSTLLRMNGCKAYKNVGRYAIVGRPSDVQVVRYLYSWLCREIDRLTGKHCAGNGRTYCNNFRIGAAETISERLCAQQKVTRQAVVREIETGSLPLEHKKMALMRVNTAIAAVDKKLEEVETWTRANLKLGKAQAGRVTYDGSARAAGRQAGYSVRMGKPVAHLN